MLIFEEDARRVLMAASEVARLRGADVLGESDVAIALIIDASRPGADAAWETNNSSPASLPFSPTLEAVAGSGTPEAPTPLSALVATTMNHPAARALLVAEKA